MTRMTVPATAPRLRTAIRAVLVVFPLLYLLHGFVPHTAELFGDEDHSRWWQFWGVAAALHWTSVAVALGTLRSFGVHPRVIGLPASVGTLARTLGALAVFGVVLVAARSALGPLTWLGDAVPVFGAAAPATTPERLAWILMALTAGFCEEVVYRGYSIGGQRAAGVRLGPALVWSTVAFVFLHGFSAFELFPLYIAVGLVFAALYLRTGSLLPGIIIHGALDLLVILVS